MVTPSLKIFEGMSCQPNNNIALIPGIHANGVSISDVALLDNSLLILAMLLVTTCKRFHSKTLISYEMNSIIPRQCQVKLADSHSQD